MEKLDENLELKRVMMVDDEGNIIGSTTAVSVVSEPANELSTLFLKAQGKEVVHKFKVSSLERQEIVGAALVPYKPMKREYKDGQGRGTGEYYYIYFTPEDVRAAHDYYRMYANTQQSNPEHLRNFSDKIRSTQSWIVESDTMDKAYALGYTKEEIPVGTWMHTFKVTDKEAWLNLKDSDLTGLSPELRGFEVNVEEMLSAVEMPVPYGMEIKPTINPLAPEKTEQETNANDSADSTSSDEISIDSVVDQESNYLYKTIKAIVFDREMSDEVKYKIVAKILRKMK